MKKRAIKIPLFAKILLGMILGVLFGFVAVWAGFDKFVTNWVAPWGVIFIRLLKLIAIPLVFFSLVIGIGNLKNIRSLSRMGLKTIGIYILTTVVAVLLAMGVVSLIRPGEIMGSERTEEYRQVYGTTLQADDDLAAAIERRPLDFIVDIVPENIISAASDNGMILQIIFFAILFGVAIIYVGEEKTAPLMKVVDALNEVILKIISFAMKFAPVGVFALMADLVVNFAGDGAIFASLGVYIFTLLLTLVVLTYLIYPLLVRIFGNKKPLEFLRAALPVQLVAFSTSSSAATLPVTMEYTEKKLGVSNETASFVLPVGATINMDGTSCYQVIAVFFIAQIMGLDFTIGQILTIIGVTVISSIGTPGIPGGSIIMLMVVLGSVGIPAEWLALILGVDRPMDMMRTVTNVTGDMTVATIVDSGGSTLSSVK